MKFVRVGWLFEYLILCRGFDEASQVCIDQRHRNRRTKEMQNHAISLDESNETLLQLLIEKSISLTFFILHDITLNNIAEFLEMRSRRNIMSVQSITQREGKSISHFRSSSVISSLIPPMKIFFTVDCRSGREASSRGMARLGSVCRPLIV